MLKGKGKQTYKDKGCANYFDPRLECLDQKTKLKTEESSNSQRDQKKKTCQYCGKIGHVENTYWKKRIDIEEKVKIL